MKARRHFFITALIAVMMSGCGKSEPGPTTGQPGVVRVAVIGGMVTTGLWQAITERFEAATGLKVKLVITGEREI
jgi:hypothetical protein